MHPDKQGAETVRLDLPAHGRGRQSLRVGVDPVAAGKGERTGRLVGPRCPTAGLAEDR
jgi:hypothetical protein